jgi:hypothetical protein
MTYREDRENKKKILLCSFIFISNYTSKDSKIVFGVNNLVIIEHHSNEKRDCNRKL